MTQKRNLVFALAIGVLLGTALTWRSSRETSRLRSKLQPSPSTAPTITVDGGPTVNEGIWVQRLTRQNEPAQTNTVLTAKEKRRRRFERFERYLDKATTRVMEERGVKYANAFIEFGVPVERTDALQSQLASIYRQVVLAEQAIKDLQLARLQYREDLRSLMSDEDYARYEQWENRKPAVREMDWFKKAIGDAGLDPMHEQTLVTLIHENAAYTADADWTGAFGETPAPIMGEQPVMQDALEWQSWLRQLAEEMPRKAAEAGLPSPYPTLLDRYYQKRAEYYQDIWDYYQRPKDERMREVIEALGSTPGGTSP